MDFFDFGIYFAAVIVVSVFVFWIVFLLVRSLRPQKQTKRKMLTAGKKSPIKRIAQKSQKKQSETETEIEFDENDIESKDLSEKPPKQEQESKSKTPVETKPETSMAMESGTKGEETKQTAISLNENHSLVTGESSEQTQTPVSETTTEQTQTPVSAITSEPDNSVSQETAVEPDQSGETSGEEQIQTEETKQPTDEAPEGASTVTVLDDIGEMTGEPPSVTEESEGDGDLFDVFDTELEEESKLSDFAAGLSDIDLSDIQDLSKSLHAILPARPKSDTSEEEHKE
jgi:hypothetical protein